MKWKQTIAHGWVIRLPRTLSVVIWDERRWQSQQDRAADTKLAQGDLLHVSAFKKRREFDLRPAGRPVREGQVAMAKEHEPFGGAVGHQSQHHGALWQPDKDAAGIELQWQRVTGNDCPLLMPQHAPAAKVD